MIGIKIEGLTETVKDMQDWTHFIDPVEMDRAVQKATAPLIRQIKDGYRSAGLVKSGALIDSIEAFQRRRKGNNDPLFTYYVGPKWGTKLFKGGNHAVLLEYGTVERFRANTSKGGAGRTKDGRRTGLKSVYGPVSRTGKVRPYGVLRTSRDALS